MPSTPLCPPRACTRSRLRGMTAPTLLLVWSAFPAQKHRWFDDVQYTRRQSGFSRLDFFLPGVLEVLSSLYIPRSQPPSVRLQWLPPPSLPCWRPTYQTRIDISLISSDLINKKTTPPSPLPYSHPYFQSRFLSPTSSTSHEIPRLVAFFASLPVFFVSPSPLFLRLPKGTCYTAFCSGGKR